MQIARQSVAFLDCRQLFAGRQQGVELFGHAVEVLPQLANLIAGGIAHLDRKLALAPGVRRLGDAAQPAGDVARDQQAGQRANHTGEQDEIQTIVLQVVPKDAEKLRNMGDTRTRRRDGNLTSFRTGSRLLAGTLACWQEG